MTAAGVRMTHDRISKLERGEAELLYLEAVFFAGVLEEQFVRLASPREGEEIGVRVDGWRHALRPVELRNWFVFGHWWTPAATAAQHGMSLAQAAYAVLRPRDEGQRSAARTRVAELIRREPTRREPTRP